ncbi:MAG: SIR2 family NAD-dependent protein deacylase [Sulfuricella sp.]
MNDIMNEIATALAAGSVVPYLGPGLLEPDGENPVPSTFETLAGRLSARVTVPFKIRANMTATAQYIENFKHRKTLVAVMKEIFQPPVTPSALHSYFASLPNLPLLVDTWYDAAAQAALAERKNWGQIQGVSRAEHRDQWVKYYRPDGSETDAHQAQEWETVLYKPFGSIAPAANFIVSDSDFVEVLTEIDIQTPIPPRVQELRSGRRFLFIGCRFRNQLERAYARQIMKRSSNGPHWAVLPDELTKNEIKFMAEQNIQRLEMTAADFLASLAGVVVAA